MSVKARDGGEYHFHYCWCQTCAIVGPFDIANCLFPTRNTIKFLIISRRLGAKGRENHLWKSERVRARAGLF